MDFDNDAPLNKIPNESNKANSALHDYWLMGGGRSLDKLMALYLDPTNPLLKAPPTKKINTLKTWSQKNHWQVRIKRQKEIDDEIALDRYRERHMPPAEVIARLSDMGRADMADFADVRQPSDLEGKLNSHLVKKIKVTARRNKDGTITARTEIELYDAQSALEKIARHYGLFTDKIEHSWRQKLPNELQDEAEKFFREMAERLAEKDELDNG